MKDNLKQYLYEEVPDNLFTRNELQLMSMIPLNIDEPDASVYYPEQRRSFKLYDIKKTRKREKYKPKTPELPVIILTIDEVLERRRRYIKQREKMYGTK